MTTSPFNHRPDPKLGKALRELLTPEDHRAFVSRVVASARSQFNRDLAVADWWDVLSAWARPGLAAALLLALLGAFGLQSAPERPVAHVTIDNTLADAAATDERTSLLVSPSPPSVDVVLASQFEN